MNHRSHPVIVVGGGVGGLSLAIRLRAAGHPVTVVERNGHVGGKLATYERDGFVFDIGPSLVTMPGLIDDTLATAGTRLDEHVELKRLDPQFRYNWRDDDLRGGGSLVVHDEPDATADAFDDFASGAGGEWRTFDARGRQIWEVADRTFFAGPMGSPVALIERIHSLRDLTSIDASRTLWTASRRIFTDKRLHQWVGRYATYSGSSPFIAPATLACIPHIESRFGCWYPTGGVGRIRDVLAYVAAESGVHLVTGSEVVRVCRTIMRVTGVQLADGSYLNAPIVVANVDAQHLYGDLFPDTRELNRVQRAGRSTSGFALCLGVRGETAGIEHHNVWFSTDFLQEFRELAAGRLADDPTIYGCVSSVTDPTQVPELGDGAENWFLLINTPPGVKIDGESYRNVVLERLAQHGVDLRERMHFAAHLTPDDIESMYRSPGGAIYGTSSNGRIAAFRRPANRGPVEGLYLVGGSSHPGGGLPLVSISARIVADLIAADST